MCGWQGTALIKIIIKYKYYVKQDDVSTTGMMILSDSYSAISVFHKRKYPLDNNIYELLNCTCPQKMSKKKKDNTLSTCTSFTVRHTGKTHADYYFKKI